MILTGVRVLCVGMVCLAGSAPAELITNTFSGEVTRLRAGPDSLGHPENNSDGPAIGGTFGGLVSGDAVTFRFVYDSLAGPRWSPSPEASEYGVVSWSITARGVSIGDVGTSDYILVYDNSDQLGDPTDLFAVGIQDGYWASVEFQDRGMDALDSTAIPNAFDFGNWEQQILGFGSDGLFGLPGSMLAGSEDNVETVYAFFRVDGFYSSVPEPTTKVLLGVALVLFLVKRRGAAWTERIAGRLAALHVDPAFVEREGMVP